MFDGRGDGVPVASISHLHAPKGALLCIHSCEEAESLMRVLELRFTDEDLAKAKEHVTCRRREGQGASRRRGAARFCRG